MCQPSSFLGLQHRHKPISWVPTCTEQYIRGKSNLPPKYHHCRSDSRAVNCCSISHYKKWQISVPIVLLPARSPFSISVAPCLIETFHHPVRLGVQCSSMFYEFLGFGTILGILLIRNSFLDPSVVLMVPRIY